MAWSLVALLAALSIAGCETPCTDIGCAGDTRFDIVTSDPSTLTGATITICVDNQCASATVVMPTDVGPGATTRLSGNLVGAKCDSFLADDQTVDVVGDIPTPLNPTSNSVYTATLIAADGTAIVSRQWTATYRGDYRPNGPDCSPTCFVADLTPG
jgi:hypothetical protein